jgi:hypothetical protein
VALQTVNHDDDEPSLTSLIERGEGYQTIGPLPFRRLAAAHSDTADAVFRKVLRKPNFTWAEHGEARMRRRKPWYCELEPRTARQGPAR